MDISKSISDFNNYASQLGGLDDEKVSKNEVGDDDDDYELGLLPMKSLGVCPT